MNMTIIIRNTMVIITILAIWTTNAIRITVITLWDGVHICTTLSKVGIYFEMHLKGDYMRFASGKFCNEQQAKNFSFIFHTLLSSLNTRIKRA